MGVIKRQGIKQSLVNYFGVGIAALSTIFIYPLEREAYGLSQFLIGIAQFLIPFALLGGHMVVIRFFPQFRNPKNGHNGILPLAGFLAVLGCVLFMISYYFFDDWIYRTLYSDKSPLFRIYLPYVVPLTIFLSFLSLFYYYASNFKRIVIPAIFHNSIKVTLPILILLYILDYISLDWVVGGVVLNYVLAVLGLAFYLMYLKQWHWKPNLSFLTKKRKEEIINYAFYGILLSMGTVLFFRIDSFMISTIVGLESNGTYSISLFIGSAIAIPSTALMQIAAPIITDAFAKDDIPHIEMIYQKSSINLFLVGLYLLAGVLLCLEDLYALMPGDGGVRDGFWVVVLIGGGKLIDMVTSVNNQIINYSPKYRFGLYAILLLAIFNVLLNLWLIPIFGITGAAMATFTSITLYNLVKLIFIYLNWRIQPFQWSTLKAIVLVAVLAVGIDQLPTVQLPLLSILIKGSLLTLLLVPAIYYLKLSADINDMIDQLWKKIKTQR